jgi:hypothetical protein
MMEDEVSVQNIQEESKNDKSCLLDDDQITDDWLRSKYKILKNLLVIGFAWIFQFTGITSFISYFN